MDAGPPFDAFWLLSMLRKQPAFRGRLEVIGQAGANPNRTAGLPWREQSIRDVRGDTAAIEKWLGEQRAVAAVLPPQMRRLTSILARDLDAPINLSAGRSIAPQAAKRLEDIAVRRLTPGAEPLDASDRVFMHRALQTLDPVSPPVVTAEVRSVFSPGGVAAVSATSAGRGNWRYEAPREGFPVIGKAISAVGDSVSVVPFELPSPKPRAGPYFRK